MEDGNSDAAGPATRAIGAGRDGDWARHVANPPVYRASTHLFTNCAELRNTHADDTDGRRFFYGRQGSPTQWALEDALTEMERGAAGTVLYPSGLAAVTGALLTVLQPGDTLLMTDNAYAPSRAFATGFLKRMGVATRFFDPFDHAALAELFDSATKAVLLESPGSLTMEVCDVPALAATARKRGAAVLLDNTWATGIGFPALAHGCDIAIMALTKHVGGHSDVMLGSCTAGEAWHRKLRHTARALGHVASPDDAALALRGLRTMPLRLERQTQAALYVAEWLSGREEVESVHCPMLPGSQGHALWTRDFTGGCGLFSFTLRNADDAARCRLVDTLRLFGIGYSWGGYESLALPIDPAACRSVMGGPIRGKSMIRLSIGLEDPADLVADLTRAFAAIG